MERTITGFHHDDEGDWVAELSCGHDQHVRHRPPFQLRPWIESAQGRAERLDSLLPCPLCDRSEMPVVARHIRSDPEWDERTMPAVLRTPHRIEQGTWGRVAVRGGRLRLVVETEPRLDVVLGPGSVQAIPPDVEHAVQPVGSVRFAVDFLSVERSGTASGRRPNVDLGGDPACWAHLVCAECGAIMDSGPHVHR